MNATLEHIWHEFAAKLGQFIRARVNDPATADDILQDVFVKIQARLDQAAADVEQMMTDAGYYDS